MFVQNEIIKTTEKIKAAKIFCKIVTMLAIGFICTPAGSFANDYTWPPRENAPVLTLLGPVYETDLELESELTNTCRLPQKISQFSGMLSSRKLH